MKELMMALYLLGQSVVDWKYLGTDFLRTEVKLRH